MKKSSQKKKMSARPLSEIREEFLKDPKAKHEYDKLEPEFSLFRLMIEKRMKEGLTQKEIAKRMKTKQSAISRFEHGEGNPTIGFIYDLARALGAQIEFKIK